MSDPDCQGAELFGFHTPLCLVEADDPDLSWSEQLDVLMDRLTPEEQQAVLKRIWDSRPDIREAAPWLAGAFENRDDD